MPLGAIYSPTRATLPSLTNPFTGSMLPAYAAASTPALPQYETAVPAAPSSLTPAPPGTADPGGVNTETHGGSSTGSYGQALTSDPLYIQTQADINAQRVASQAALLAAQERSLIQFGELPAYGGPEASLTGLSIAGNPWDPATQTLAQQNTTAGLSTVARLSQTHDDRVRAITNALAGHGMLFSGDTGFRQNREIQDYSVAQYDAREKLLDYLANLAGGYTQGELAREAELRNALESAYARALALSQAGIGPGGGGGASGGSGGGSGPTYLPQAPPGTANPGQITGEIGIPPWTAPIIPLPGPGSGIGGPY